MNVKYLCKTIVFVVLCISFLPVCADEPVDALTQFNALLGERPANKNNAFVGLIEACAAVDDWDADYREALFTELGLETDVALQGDRLAVLPEHLEHALFKAIKGPWTNDQYPDLARWMDEQARAIERIEVILRRPHYYAPTVFLPEEPVVLIAAFGPHLGWSVPYAEYSQFKPIAHWVRVMYRRPGDRFNLYF